MSDPPSIPLPLPRKKKRASRKPTKSHTLGMRQPICHILNSASSSFRISQQNTFKKRFNVNFTSFFFQSYSQARQHHFDRICFSLLRKIVEKRLLYEICDHTDSLANVLSKNRGVLTCVTSLITGRVPGLVIVNVIIPSPLNLN